MANIERFWLSVKTKVFFLFFFLFLHSRDQVQIRFQVQDRRRITVNLQKKVVQYNLMQFVVQAQPDWEVMQEVWVLEVRTTVVCCAPQQFPSFCSSPEVLSNIVRLGRNPISIQQILKLGFRSEIESLRKHDTSRLLWWDWMFYLPLNYSFITHIFFSEAKPRWLLSSLITVKYSAEPEL